jgi:hypothetical protein
MFNDGKDFLIFIFEDMENLFTDDHHNAMKKFNKFNNQIDSCSTKKIQIMEDIKMVLYNERHKPMTNKSHSSTTIH